MKRSARFNVTKALVLVFAMLAFFPAQARAQGVRIKTIHVAGPVYMLVGRGGNIGVTAGEDGLLMIDDQFDWLAPKIKAALKKLGAGPLAFLLNTHWHGDHTGGNAIFGEEAHIISHTNVRKRLSRTSHVLGRTVKPKPKVGLPIITFDASLSIHFNGEEIRAIHYPHGHTDGDMVVFFTKSNVVHMGDLFFEGRFPFVDLKNGGDVEGYVKNVGLLIDKIPRDAKIIPGHGTLSDIKGLKTYHHVLVETTEIIRRHLRAGKSLARVRAEGLPKRYDAWGKSFISTGRWIGTIYESLKRK